MTDDRDFLNPPQQLYTPINSPATAPEILNATPGLLLAAAGAFSPDFYGRTRAHGRTRAQLRITPGA